MKTAIRTSVLYAAVLLMSASGLSAESQTPGISSAIETVIDKYTHILPENSSLLGVQPEAYIGKLFPSVPPHFTAGISVSGTFLDTSFLSDGMKNVGDAIGSALSASGATDDTISISLDMPDRIPYPAASVSARIGGIVLPFDIGLHAVTTVGSMFDSMDFGDADVSSDYMTVGADIRYRVYEESLFIPQISLGGGYVYSKHTLALGAENSYTIKDGGAAAKLATQLDMSVATHTIFAQIQASKKILILTPFIGFRALFTKADCEYSWQYETKIDGTKKDEFSDRDSRAYTADFSDVGLSTQVFGGVGLQIALFQLGLTVSYNFMTKYVSGAVLLDFKM